MRTPCDESVMRSASADVPVKRDARLWILTATILGSSLAFIDGTVVNVALPAVQANFHATVVDLQWVVESYGLFLAAGWLSMLPGAGYSSSISLLRRP